MNDPLLIALIVGVPTAIAAMMGPILLSILTSNQRRQEKRDDNERQDQVAARVQEAADKAAIAAELLVESNKTVASTTENSTKMTLGKLDIIHTLVNSNMSASKKAELDATIAQLAMMNELIALKNGDKASEFTLAAVETAQRRITELTEELRARTEQDELAKKQQNVLDQKLVE